MHDTVLDRECVLSLIRADLLPHEELERLHLEARTMARLSSHPHVVAIYDFGDEAGRPYFVSEYISGGDLRDELRRAGGALTIDRALTIAAGAAEALAEAHALSIVHRDVKPANILIDTRGNARLADFGLAYQVDTTELVQEDALMGTAAYMAPEQALGRGADERSDLYALGATLYELLTGRPPFIGHDALAVISQAINTAPVAPSWHNALVPRALDSVVLRMLQKAPEDRASSAAEVAAELRRIRDEVGSAAPVEIASSLPELQGMAWGQFVGRQAELSKLRDGLERAFAGAGGVATISGEPGIGKTRLADEFAVYARLRGAVVLTGRSFEGESAVPYGPFVEALRPFVVSHPDDELREDLGAGAAEMALLLPELTHRFTDIQPSAPLEGEAERFRLFERVAAFLQSASARAPIVLSLDDLHWADAPSLLLLQYIVRRISAARIFVFGTYRDTELHRTHPLGKVIASIRNEVPFERIQLRGLPPDEVIDLLMAVEATPGSEQGRERLAAALQEQTEGNPFFIREILSHLVEEGRIYREGGSWRSNVTDMLEMGIPEGLREVIGLRLSKLSDGCNDLLATASLMLGGFTWQELAAAGDGGDGGLIALIEEALSAQLIAERRTGRTSIYEFTHALIGSTLRDELSTPRRFTLHARIGEALERLYAAAIDEHASQLAHHFYHAAPAIDIDRALAYINRAGERAVAALAYEDATLQFRRAVELLELRPPVDPAQMCDVLLRLGDAYARAGETTPMRVTFQSAAKHARDIGDAALLARAALGFGRGEEDFVGEDETLIVLLREALDAMPDDGSTLRAMLLARLATATLTAGDDETVEALSREAVAAARAAGDPQTLVLALNARHEALFSPDDLEERIAIADEAARLSMDIPDRAASWYSHDWRLTDMLESGDMAGVDSELGVLAGIAAELRQPLWIGLTRVAQTTRELLSGRFADAERMIAENEAAANRLGAQSLLFYSQWQRFWLRREQGRIVETDAFVRAWVPDAANVGRYVRFVAIRHAEMGDLGAAREAFTTAAKNGFGAPIFDNTWIHTLALASEVCSFVDDAERAADLYEKLLPYAARNVIGGDVICLGAVARYLALLACTLGRADDAERHFLHAIELHARMGARPFLARTQYEYGRMHARAGDQQAGAPLLEHAETIAREIGMDGLLRSIEALRGSR